MSLCCQHSRTIISQSDLLLFCYLLYTCINSHCYYQWLNIVSCCDIKWLLWKATHEYIYYMVNEVFGNIMVLALPHKSNIDQT